MGAGVIDAGTITGKRHYKRALLPASAASSRNRNRRRNA